MLFDLHKNRASARALSLLLALHLGLGLRYSRFSGIFWDPFSRYAHDDDDDDRAFCLLPLLPSPIVPSPTSPMRKIHAVRCKDRHFQAVPAFYTNFEVVRLKVNG